MWFMVALFVASIVISLVLAPKPKLTNAKAGKLNEFQFPKADYGSPVTRIYGTVKFKAPNTIWSGDFKAVPIKKKVKTGLFSSKKQTIGYKYYVGFDLAVCLGPGFTFRRLWSGTNELWNGCLEACVNVVTIDLPNLYGGEEKNGGFKGDIAFYCGDFDQPRDDYLAQKVSPNVPAYVGIAHMVFRGCYVGNSTSIPPIFVEGSCFSNSLEIGQFENVMSNGLDANPVEVLYDIIVNDWGNLGVTADLINKPQWREVARKVQAEGNGMSVIISSAAQGAEVAQMILSQISGTLFEDPATGLFDLVLLRDDYELEDLPILGPSEIISISNFTKMLWSETYNRVRVKFTDRANGFKEDSIALAEDFANIRFQKKPRTNDVTFEGIYDAALANDVAARELSNINVPLYSMELEISRLAANLRPGSPFILYWPEYGIELMVCRLRKFGLGTLQNGKLTAQVVQDQFSVNATVIAAPVNHALPPADRSPQQIVSRVVFELPYYLDKHSDPAPAGETKYAVFAEAPGAYSTEFNGYIEGNETPLVLDTVAYTNKAILALDLPTFAGFDDGVQADVKIVGLYAGDDEEVLTNDNNVREAGGLFYLNGEILAYESFTAIDGGMFYLLNVHRALLDTAYVGGKEGDVVFFFDGQEAFFEGGIPNGETSQLFLQDIAAGGVFSAAEAERVPLTPAGRRDRPLPPDAVKVDGERKLGHVVNGVNPIVLTWAARSRLSDNVAFELDVSEVEEPGTTYRLEIFSVEDDAVIQTIDPIVSGDQIPITPDMIGGHILSVYAKRDGLLSFTPAVYPLEVLPSKLLFIDGDRVLIDGDRVDIMEIEPQLGEARVDGSYATADGTRIKIDG
jgi:hypothetical protein